MSYLASQNIKRRLFQILSENNYGIKRATRLLAKYSMIDIVETNYGTEDSVREHIQTEEDESDETCFQFQRTVQYVTRLHLKENNEDEVTEYMFKVLNKYLILTHSDVVNFDEVREGFPHIEIETFFMYIKHQVNENPEEKDIKMYSDVVEFLSMNHFCLGNPEILKELLEESLTAYKKFCSSDHYHIARTLTNLGMTYKSLGDVVKQKEVSEKALEIKEQHYGPNHCEVAITLMNLGNAYGSLGDVLKQRELLEKVLNINEKHFGPDHSEVAETLILLGAADWGLGNIRKQK